jgi:polyhydroxyalkanoate synthesis regulator phasin
MIIKNILLLSTILAIIAIFTVETSHAVEQIDQTYTDTSTRLILNRVSYASQTFTPTVNSLSSIDIYLSSASRSNADVELYTKDVITGENIRVHQTVVFTDSTPMKVNFPFPHAIALQPNVEHRFTVKLSSVSYENDVYMHGAKEGAYPYGSASYVICSGTLCQVFSRSEDYAFTTYYTIETPEEQTQEIVDDVLDLLTSGDISTQSASSLTSTLETAIDKIEDGNTTSATGMLDAFINKVEQMIQTGKITQEDGQALIDAANSVIDSL